MRVTGLHAAVCAAVVVKAWGQNDGQPVDGQFDRFLPVTPNSCSNAANTQVVSAESLFECQAACIARGDDCQGVLYRPRCVRQCGDACPLDCDGRSNSGAACELLLTSPCRKSDMRTYSRSTNNGQFCGVKDYDLIFVMDESGSVGDENYNLMKRFVVEVSSTIKHNVEKKLRDISLIEFAFVANTNLEFGEDMTDFEEFTLAQSLRGGTTNIDDGLTDALTLRRNNLDRKTIVVLLTDGEPNVFGPNGSQRDEDRAVQEARSAAEDLTAIPNTELVYARIVSAKEDLFDGISNVRDFFIGDWALDEFIVTLEGLIEEAVCVTEAPTKSPTPLPTSDRPTISPTKAPSSTPTFSPTTLPPSTCTVLDSGESSVVFPNPDLSESELKSRFVVSAGASVTSSALTLTDKTRTSAAHTLFYAVQQNLVGGFIADFVLTVDEEDRDQGFAFVIQRHGTTDLPVSTGKGLGFARIPSSVAVVFDMCSDRSSGLDICQEQSVFLSYNPVAGATLPAVDPLVTSPPRLSSYNVRVIYLEQAERIQVILDPNTGQEEVVFSQNNFRIESIVGNVDAFLGFTTATANTPLTHEITRFNVQTVPIVNEKTQPVDFDQVEKTLVADGKSAVGYSVQVFDFCDTEITYGGSGSFLHSVFIEQVNEETGLYSGASGASASRRLRALQGDDEEESEVDAAKLVPHIVNGGVVDNNDGTYTATLVSSFENVTYALAASYGDDDDCDLEVEMSGDEGELQSASVDVVGNRNRCFFGTVENAIVTVPPPPGFEDNGGGDPFEGEESNIAAIAVGGGVAAMGLIVASVAVSRYRNKWREDKGFIDQGKVYKLEKDIQYADDSELASLHGSVLATRQAILKEKSQGAAKSKAAEIQKLESERKELRSMVRANKQMNQESRVSVSKPNPMFKNVRKEYQARPDR